MNTTEILNELKGHFKAGAQPTQAQFEKLIDTYLVNNNDKVGIGTTVPLNTLDVNGQMVIGVNHAGQETAPANGLIVEGNVGIGHNIADESLHVNGNVKIDAGNLYMGEKLVITSAGEWNGVAISGDDDNQGATSWTDGLEKVTTNEKVGIGVANPTSELHLNGDLTIDNGNVKISGLISQKQVVFNAFGINSISPTTKIVLLEDTISQQENTEFWDANTSVFQPDTAHAGTYFFMVSLTLKPSGEKEEAPTDGRVFFTISAADEALLFEEVMSIREPNPSLHSSTSLLLHMDGNTSISVRTDNPSLQIESISFSGYRI